MRAATVGVRVLKSPSVVSFVLVFASCAASVHGRRNPQKSRVTVFWFRFARYLHLSYK